MTDHAMVDLFRATKPHTYNAMTKLVMAMAKMLRDHNKKTLFGRDKGVIAYRDFQERLRDTLIAMSLDGALRPSTSDDEAASLVLDQIRQFSVAHPNWQDAYTFAAIFFGLGEYKESPFDAVDSIRRLR